MIRIWLNDRAPLRLTRLVPVLSLAALAGVAWVPAHADAPRRAALRQATQAPRASIAEAAKPRLGDTPGFSHARHITIKCANCHTFSASSRVMKLKVPDDCRACHHAADARAGACAACHAAAELNHGVAARVRFDVSARKSGPVTRTVVFRHDVHEPFECVECHGTPVAPRAADSCNACHDLHHDPARNCLACHPTASVGHDRAVHDDCTACHTAASAAELTASRSLCLACHPKQGTHNAGRECAACHAVNLSSRARKGGGR
ncbi:MAG TPA: cytochrome c3 family protein [Gemmatimonadaceae bacterium]